MKIGKRPARILLYEQVVEDLCLLIDRGDFEPGDQLPSERELIEKLIVSRNVLREAFHVLESRGVIVSHQGKGRFLRESPISGKEKRYDSEVAQGGNNVSGGQKQRLAIARAIAKQPKIYVFDDSFSALDYKTDAALRKALNSEVADATVIIVAQRISTIMHADQILYWKMAESLVAERTKNCLQKMKYINRLPDHS